MTITHQSDWLTWLLGFAALATVVGAVIHFSEIEALVALTRTADPQWLVLAIVLQAATYLVEGGIWYRVGRAAGFPVDLGTAMRFSLVKLFTDQAIPSVGLSGNLVVAQALARMGMPSRAIAAGVVVRITSYYAAYVVCLGVALWIVVAQGHANSLIVAVSVLFAAFSALSCIGLLALSGHRPGRWANALTRHAHLQRGLDLLQGSDSRLVQNRTLQLQAMVLQTGIVLLDAATIWALVRALGLSASPSDIFASFMLSTVFRSIGILPGGLGSFEAASVLTLSAVGIPIEAALAATLMFRGLSFWLPMLPGFWFSRRLAASGGDAVARGPRDR